MQLLFPEKGWKSCRLSIQTNMIDIDPIYDPGLSGSFARINSAIVPCELLKNDL